MFDAELLVDMLMSTNLSLRDIAKELKTTEQLVRQFIRDNKLGWIRRNQGSLSRGQASLTAIIRKLIPGVEIRTEEHIGERLRLDVYCPKFQLAAEFHGIQHFKFTPFFHPTYEDFLESQRRDERKLELCQNLGIVLAVFRFNDNLSEDMVYVRLMEAIKSGPAPPPKNLNKQSLRGNEYYEKAKQRNREYKKEMYRKLKQKYKDD